MADVPAKYLVLLEWIKERIHAGELVPGDKMYSENELCSMFDFSRQTVRHAMAILEQEGLVERRRGSGTYISASPTAAVLASRNIGVVTTYLDSYIFPSIIKGIEGVLAKEGYSVQLSLTRNRVESEERALRSMIDGNVSGIIAEPTKSGLPNPNGELYAELARKNIPVLFINAYYPDYPFPHVCLDDYLAGKMATEYLIKKGHRRIAAMFQSDDRQGHLRYKGHIDALKAAGLSVRAENILWFSTEDIPYFTNDFQRIERTIEDCTGLLCYNDRVAFTVITEGIKRGLKIPDELSVVGIDDADVAAICEVPITTFANPVEQLGKTAARNMLALIRNPEFDGTKEFAPQLVERASVRPTGGAVE